MNPGDQSQIPAMSTLRRLITRYRNGLLVLAFLVVCGLAGRSIPKLFDFWVLATVLLALTLYAAVSPGTFLKVVIAVAILFTLPLRRFVLFEIRDMVVTPADVITAVSILTIVLLAFWKPGKGIFSSTSTKIFIGYLIWSLISTFRGLPTYGISALREASFYYFPMALYFLVLLALVKKRDIYSFAKWGLLSIFGLVAFRLARILPGLGSETAVVSSVREPFWFFSGTESLYLVFAFIGLLIFALGGQLRYRRLTFVVILGLGVLIFVVPNRSSWLALAAALLATFTLFRAGIAWKTVFTVGAIALLVFGGLTSTIVIKGVSLADSLRWSTAFLGGIENDPNAMWRLEATQQELAKALQSPIIGRGYGGFTEYIFHGSKWEGTTAHNGYVMVFSKTGLVGLLLYLAGILALLVELRRGVLHLELDRRMQLLLVSLSAIIVGHLAFTMIYYETFLFWPLIGVATVLSRLPLEKRNATHEGK